MSAAGPPDAAGDQRPAAEDAHATAAAPVTRSADHGHRPPRPRSTQAHDRRWPASVAVALVLLLQLGVPAQVTAVPHWLLPACAGALLVPLVVANPGRLRRDRPWLRMVAITLAAVLVAVNAVNLIGLVRFLVSGTTAASSGRTLVQAAALIWVVNVVAFAVWFWEIDRGGPFARHPGHRRPADKPDLLFPQMNTDVPGWRPDQWLPTFTDYTFVAFTTATAFSPTDTLPLSGRAKILMMAETVIALVVIAVVAARAVNVL